MKLAFPVNYYQGLNENAVHHPLDFFFILNSLLYIYSPYLVVWDYLIGSLEISVVFCGVLPLNLFFSPSCSFAEENEKR